MAINPNPKLPNRHAGYFGITGSGKSQALKQNKALPARGVRVVLWDISHDHGKGTSYYSSRLEFVKALLRANASKRGFRIAWDGESSAKTLEWFFRVVWEILDGNKLTFTVIEELARCVETVGRAAPQLRKFCNEGRKYGGVLHFTTQRPQEIPKTVYDACAVFYVGKQKNANIKKFALLIDVPEPEIKALKQLEFWHYDENSGESAQKIKLKYKS